MRLILLSSLLLCGIIMANGELSQAEGEVLSSIMQSMMILQRKLSNLKYAFLAIHKARSFANGSERMFRTNNEVGSFAVAKEYCEQSEGQIPSPKLENDNKAFANVLERENKEAYIIVGDSANFTNWAEGQPNAADGACTKADTHGVWHSTSCEEDLLVMCEFSFSL